MGELIRCQDAKATVIVRGFPSPRHCDCRASHGVTNTVRQSMLASRRPITLPVATVLETDPVRHP